MQCLETLKSGTGLVSGRWPSGLGPDDPFPVSQLLAVSGQHPRGVVTFELGSGHRLLWAWFWACQLLVHFPSLPTPVLSCGLKQHGPGMGPEEPPLPGRPGVGKSRAPGLKAPGTVPAQVSWPLPSPSLLRQRHLEAHIPVHVLFLTSGGFVASPHLHKKYHTPQLNEQGPISGRCRLPLG